jgi:hypothetical protein
LRRREKLADRYDSTFWPAIKIADDLWSLFNNRFEAITIDDVQVSGTVDPAYVEAALVGLEAWSRRALADGQSAHPVAPRRRK